LFYCFIAVLSLIISTKQSIRIPYSEVPVTTQTLCVHLVGFFLGRSLALVSLLVFIILGLSGVPVIGNYLNKRFTWGYVFGFVVSCYVTTTVQECAKDLWEKMAILFVGDLIILACGSSWLSRYVEHGKAIEKGVLPFLPGSILKCCTACWIIYLHETKYSNIQT